MGANVRCESGMMQNKDFLRQVDGFSTLDILTAEGCTRPKYLVNVLKPKAHVIDSGL